MSSLSDEEVIIHILNSLKDEYKKLIITIDLLISLV